MSTQGSFGRSLEKRPVDFVYTMSSKRTPKTKSRTVGTQNNARSSKTVSVPSARASVRKTMAPRIRQAGTTIMVKHTEYVREILPASSSGNFLGISSPDTLLNPTNPTLFPWLSNISRNYEFFSLSSPSISPRV